MSDFIAPPYDFHAIFPSLDADQIIELKEWYKDVVENIHPTKGIPCNYRIALDSHNEILRHRCWEVALPFDQIKLEGKVDFKFQYNGNSHAIFCRGKMVMIVARADSQTKICDEFFYANEEPTFAQLMECLVYSNEFEDFHWNCEIQTDDEGHEVCNLSLMDNAWIRDDGLHRLPNVEMTYHQLGYFYEILGRYLSSLHHKQYMQCRKK